MKTRLTQLITFGLLIFLLSGCSIGGTYYIRNFTSQPARITLTLSDSGTKSQEKPTLSYANELHEIRRNLYKKLMNPLMGEFIDERTLTFEVPPTSTIFFAIGTNMKMDLIETIQIESIKGIELINSNNSQQLNFKMRGIGQYTGHYDIKD